MAWEYLDTKLYEDARYKIGAEHLVTKDKIVLDLDCGSGNFRKYIDYKLYIGNDVRWPKDTSGMIFKQCNDTEIDDAHDVLCVWGYGGGELTGEPLESGTLRESIYRLIEKHRPESVLIEMVRKWEEKYNAMTEISDRVVGYGYKVKHRENIDIDDDHYHAHRMVLILCRND